LDITKSTAIKSKIDNSRLYQNQRFLYNKGYNQQTRKTSLKCNEIVTCRFYKALKHYKELLHFINKKKKILKKGKRHEYKLLQREYENGLLTDERCSAIIN